MLTIVSGPLVWIVWLLFALGGYAIGQGKGRPGEGFAAGLLLGPIGLIFIALAKDQRRRCPFCRESVAPDATVCPHCQRELADAANFTCPACGTPSRIPEDRRGHAIRCPHCKKIVRELVPQARAR